MMNNGSENLKYVQLYAEGQGDKFHPLSDTILDLFNTGEDVTVAAVEDILSTYEATPTTKHEYHIGRLRDILYAAPDDD